MARELPRARDHIRIVHNAVDLERFAPRAPLPPRPVRALMLTKFPTAVAEVRTACAAAGLEFDVVGSGVGHVVDDLPERLKRADIVFASARTAIEAMAVGCAVVVVDGRGLAGLVTPNVVAAWREDNFGRATLKQPVTAEALTEEIARYDAAAAAVVAEDVRRNQGLDRALSIYESIYRDAMASSQTVDPHDEARELSRLMRFWLPTIDGEPTITNQVMTDALKRPEADREARLQQIHTLTSLLQESDHDRALRLEQIHELTRRFEQAVRDGAERQAADAAEIIRLRAEIEMFKLLLNSPRTMVRQLATSVMQRIRRPYPP